MLSPLLFSAIVCVRQILPDGMNTNRTNEMERTWNWEFSSMVEHLPARRRLLGQSQNPKQTKKTRNELGTFLPVSCQGVNKYRYRWPVLPPLCELYPQELHSAFSFWKHCMSPRSSLLMNKPSINSSSPKPWWLVPMTVAKRPLSFGG